MPLVLKMRSPITLEGITLLPLFLVSVVVLQCFIDSPSLVALLQVNSLKLFPSNQQLKCVGGMLPPPLKGLNQSKLSIRQRLLGTFKNGVINNLKFSHTNPSYISV